MLQRGLSRTCVLAQGRPQNENIPYRFARLVDPKTNQLGAPVSIRQLLDEIEADKDRKRWQAIELIAEEPEPLIKLVDRREEYRRNNQERRERQEKRKRNEKVEPSSSGGQPKEKEVQMTWGVAAGDLAHKLKKAREALEQGNLVSIVYAPKKGQPLPTKTAMAERIQYTNELLSDVGQEWKATEAQGHTTVIYLKARK